MTTKFSTGFNSAVKKGTSPWQWVQNCSKRTGKPESTIWKSLEREGAVFCKKFNGCNVWFPVNGKKCSGTSCKKTHNFFWQYLCEYCVQQGWAKPWQLQKMSTSAICYFICSCMNKKYKKPSSYKNPSSYKMTGTTTKTGRKTKTRKTSKPKARKRTTKRTGTKRTTGRKSTTRRTGLRLAGTSRRRTTSRRYSTTTRRRAA